jgi:Ca2+-binding RTX toxin-like protein
LWIGCRHDIMRGLRQGRETPGAVSVGAVYDSNAGPITVGSGNDQCTDSPTAADKITCFSQTATFLSVLAPGAIVSAAGVTQLGTSQATPHVAGAVAALADASSTATPTEIENAIRTSGPLVADPLLNRSFHRLDIPAAVTTLANQPSPPPPPPSPPPGTCTIEGDGQDDFLQGTPGDDVICGNVGTDILVPSGGTDVVIGGAGFDFVSFQDAPTGARVDLAAGVATAGSNAVTLEEVEGAFGSEFSDELVGNGVQNELLGLGGSDVIDGAGGFDFARYDFATRRIRASLASGSARGEGSDRLVRIEGLVGGRGSDEFEGGGAANLLFGFGGNDVLSGLGRDDTLFGGMGADTLFGGRGDDDLIGGPGADTCDQQGGRGTLSSC